MSPLTCQQSQLSTHRLPDLEWYLPTYWHARHERAAPSFDEDQPEEIERYFSDLADILDTHAVVADDECKAAALKYMKHHQTNKLWRSSPTFADIGSSFVNFKDDILWLYPNFIHKPNIYDAGP